MRLDVLLQVLGTLEGFAAEVALVRLQGDVDSDVGSDVVALNGRSATVAPLTRKVEVVGALAADMALTNMVLNFFVSKWRRDESNLPGASSRMACTLT